MRRIVKAESVAYAWACGKVSTASCKLQLARLGYAVDFRQADLGAFLYALDTVTGIDVTIEV